MKTETSTTMATSTSLENSQVNGVTNRAPVGPSHNPRATATAHETTASTPSDVLTNGSTNGTANGTADDSVNISELRKAFRNKYRHVEAVHSKSKPSCLSHDTTETPSFIGFRNLMVIVLGMLPIEDDPPAVTRLNQLH
jgi:diacylglycerol O-acyltransferase-1